MERMTRQQYSAIYKGLRAELGKYTLYQKQQLQKVYLEAAEQAGKGIIDFLYTGGKGSPLNVGSLIELLKKSASTVANGTDKAVRASLTKASSIIGGTESDYIGKAIKAAGGKVSGLENIVLAINSKMIASTVNRLYADGYTFSQRIWGQNDPSGNPIGVYGDWVNKIKNIVSAGFAQGKDPADIAKLLKDYVGKFDAGGNPVEFVEARWGKLEPDTEDYLYRLGQGGIDYRALRIIRTELYSSLHDAAILAAEINPACPNKVQWILQTGREDWGCECEDYANNIYDLEDVPEFPHPNCLIAGTMIETGTGLKRIENIKSGEYVLSHKGKFNQVIATKKDYYSGKLYTIQTGQSFITGTEDHPLLVNGKWTPLPNINLGDNLRTVASKTPFPIFGKDKANYIPSFFSKKRSFFEVLNLFPIAGKVPVPAVNFNGKFYIGKSNINIELINRKIDNMVNLFINQKSAHFSFIKRICFSFTAFRTLNQFFMRCFSSPNRDICIDGIDYSTVTVRPISPFYKIRDWVINRFKITAKDIPSNSHNLRYLVKGTKFFVQKENKSFNINCNFVHTPIVQVQSKEVKEILVYNLKVDESESYVANGIVSHNCFCTLEPVLEDHTTFLDKIDDYLKGNDTQGAKDLEAWSQKYGVQID